VTRRRRGEGRENEDEDEGTEGSRERICIEGQTRVSEY
jgi:hypothetical protein